MEISKINKYKVINKQFHIKTMKSNNFLNKLIVIKIQFLDLNNKLQNYNKMEAIQIIRMYNISNQTKNTENWKN